MTEDSIESFVEKFFKMTGAKVDKKETMMTITNIPKEVLDFFGKTEPLVLAFTQSNELPLNAELITQGSFFLKNMNDYLKKKGQTSILKIDFTNKLNENVTIPIVLKEGTLYKQEKKELKDYIVRFSFMSYFQYLNEREQIVNDFFIKDGKIFDVNLELYTLLEGKTEELSVKDIKSDYLIAKEKLKAVLDKKIEALSKNLDVRLSKEIERLNGHYVQEQKEFDISLKKLERQKGEAIKEKDEKKINKVDEDIKQLNNKINSPTREIEKNFFMQDEKNKHALNISTKLINTSIIYFPTYVYSLYIKNTNVVRSVDIHFDPFNNKLSQIACDVCKKNLKEIYLCASGHVACSSCTAGRCGECSNPLCTLCHAKKCNYCSKSLCRKCEQACSVCLKKVCLNHTRKENATNKIICTGCAQSCTKCGKWYNKSKLRIDKGSSICEPCYRIGLLSKR